MSSSYTHQLSGDQLTPFNSDLSQHAIDGGIAVLTIASLTVLIREIRLLVKACRS